MLLRQRPHETRKAIHRFEPNIDTQMFEGEDLDR